MGLFKFIDTLNKFNTLRVSTVSDDSAYRIGSGLEIVGDPEILWKDICFIEDKQIIWNRGTFYSDMSALENDISGIKEDIQCIKIRKYFYTSYDESSSKYRILITGTQTTDKDMRYEIVSLSSKNLLSSDDYVYIDNNGVNSSDGRILSFNNTNQELKLYQTGGDSSKSEQLYYGYDRINFVTDTIDRYCKVIDISEFITSLPNKVPDTTTNTFSLSSGRLNIRIGSILSIYPDIYLEGNQAWDIKLCELSGLNINLSSQKISSANIVIDGLTNIEGEDLNTYAKCVNYLSNQHFKIVFKLNEFISVPISSYGIKIDKKYINRAKNTVGYIEFSNNQILTSGCAELSYLSASDYIYTKDQIDNKFYTQTYITNKLSEKENLSNKVTSISSSSTDDEYPSAKCVYDNILNELLTPVTNNELENIYGIENE